MRNRLALETAPANLPQPVTPSGKDRLDAAIERAVSYLKSVQHQDGYWLGELEADTTLESDTFFIFTCWAVSIANASQNLQNISAAGSSKTEAGTFTAEVRPRSMRRLRPTWR